MLLSLGMGIAFGLYVVGLVKLATHPTAGRVRTDYYHDKYNRLKNKFPLI